MGTLPPRFPGVGVIEVWRGGAVPVSFAQSGVGDWCPGLAVMLPPRFLGVGVVEVRRGGVVRTSFSWSGAGGWCPKLTGTTLSSRGDGAHPSSE